MVDLIVSLLQLFAFGLELDWWRQNARALIARIYAHSEDPVLHLEREEGSVVRVASRGRDRVTLDVGQPLPHVFSVAVAWHGIRIGSGIRSRIGCGHVRIGWCLMTGQHRRLQMLKIVIV